MVVDVYYDLVATAGTTYRTSLGVSTTGGEPYTITPSSVSGAIGGGIQPAEGLNIVWDAAANGGGGYTEQMRVKVTADLE